MSSAGLLIRARNRLLRSTAQRMFRRPVELRTVEPVVSFTFDDFPRSALHAGGAILKLYGCAGTYYACAGLMGQADAAGQMFLRDDLDQLLREGHELGCHTFGHLDAMLTMPGPFERSIVENREALAALRPGIDIRTFSYPKAEPNAGVKRVASRHALCCRAGGQGFNAGRVDLNCLKSFFIEQSRENVEAIKRIIHQNAGARGWLIFSTHDVTREHSPYGCTPELFEEIVRCAAQSGARLLSVAQACAAMVPGSVRA